MTIAELPFHERPVLALLNLTDDRPAPVHDYAGYGWARVDRLWLVAPETAARPVDDALLLALHCPDDAEELADDVELYFELPGELPGEASAAPAVTVLASAFFARWLPRLPQDASAIVLALCNPHGAALVRPASTALPVHHALGDVESWQARDDGRIELRAPSWRVV